MISMNVCSLWEKLENKIDLTFRRSGCAALDMAYVASGRYDGYYQSNLFMGHSSWNNTC